MKKAITFHFMFPVTDTTKLPPIHIGDMMVEANCYQHGDGSLQTDDDEQPEVDVSILFDGGNVTSLLEVVAPDTIHQVRMAAQEAAKEYDNYIEPELENGEEKAEDFANWMHKESERTFFTHD